MKEKQQWSLGTCRSKKMHLENQPIGATGTELGAVAAVKLHMELDATQANQQVSCFVVNHYGKTNCKTVVFC